MILGHFDAGPIILMIFAFFAVTTLAAWLLGLISLYRVTHSVHRRELDAWLACGAMLPVASVLFMSFVNSASPSRGLLWLYSPPAACGLLALVRWGFVRSH